MTEAEWLACEESDTMLACLRHLRSVTNPVSERKLMLFAFACCQRLCNLLPKKESRDAVDMLGLFADGSADERDLSASASRASAAERGITNQAKWRAARAASDVGMFVHARDAIWAAETVASHARSAIQPESAQEGAYQCGLLRCVFGDPRRFRIFASSLRSPAVASIAHAAYDERRLLSGHLDNARLGVLSDALEEAGCTDEAILSHLRSPGPHVRGCWALDLVLGKS